MSELVERQFPAKALLTGLRAIGYNFSTAVADIIDNSITAKATEINIYADPLDTPYFAILDNGLRINGERNLLSTVSFEALDKYVQTSGYYTLGGVIVAIPNSIKTEDGKEMFLGSPNENSKHYEGKHWDRNRQATSYAETVLVKDGTLPPEFILGTYTKDDDGIDVTLNDRHLSKTGNVVSQEEYKEIQTRMSKLIKDGTINTIVIKEMLDQKKNLRKSRGFGILGKIREMHGTREGKKEVGKIFDSWRQKSKEKETIEGRVEKTEDGIR